MEHKVQIGDIECELTVGEVMVGTRRVFVAEGKWLGKYLSAKGTSEMQAVVSWREIARLKAER